MWGAIAGAAIGALASANQGSKNRDAQSEANQMNYEQQKEFAQHGLQWKTADARAAGLHPLAAIGATGAAYSPSTQAFRGDTDFSGFERAGSALDSHLEGQNVKRPIAATETADQREMSRLAVRNAELRNALLEGQISALWASTMGQPHTPPFPSGSPQASSVGAIKVVPSQQVSSRAGDPGVEAASTPGFKNYKLTPGGLSIDLPGQEMAESLDSMGPGAGGAIATVRGLDRFLSTPEPPRIAAPAGKKWVYSAWTGKYRLVDDKPPSWRGAVSGRGSSYRPGR